MRKHVTLIGGYLTPPEALEPIADALCSSDSVGDVDSFTFLQTMERPHKVASVMKNGIAVSDSAGAVALKEALEAGMRYDRQPNQLLTCDGPEPRSILQLAKGLLAVRRNCLAIARSSSPLAGTYAHLAELGTAELWRHPLGYAENLPAVSRFSTIRLLNDSVEAGIPSAALIATDDELFPYAGTSGYSDDVTVYTHEGGHAAVLAEPQTVLKSWMDTLQ